MQITQTAFKPRWNFRVLLIWFLQMCPGLEPLANRIRLSPLLSFPTWHITTVPNPERLNTIRAERSSTRLNTGINRLRRELTAWLLGGWDDGESCCRRGYRRLHPGVSNPCRYAADACTHTSTDKQPIFKMRLSELVWFGRSNQNPNKASGMA